jgi:hypothetical protein
MSKNSSLDYIQWFEGYRFKTQVVLGVTQKYYTLEAYYHIRSDSWYVSIRAEDNKLLVQHKKLVLGFDVLEYCYDLEKPDCMLIPVTDEDTIKDINYDNMANGSVKLIHLTPEDINNLES